MPKPLSEHLKQEKITTIKAFKNNNIPVFEEINLPENLEKKALNNHKSLPSLDKNPSLLRPGKKQFKSNKKKRIAVLFSGGPAPGGHNVVAGIYTLLNKEHTLIGIRKGPKGLLENNMFEITQKQIENIKNTGGFDFLGSDRTKIKTASQFEKVKESILTQKLDGLIIIGGDDSNTNAALLANFCNKENLKCTIVGVPKTIDGDLQIKDYLPISFGFDTACKTYAELVGNVLKDTPSSQKYWHFIKLMGRSASHVTLEVALQTQPQLTFISEEIQEKKQTCQDIANQITKVIINRAEKGLFYGTILIPEGLIEFIPECQKCIESLNTIMGKEKNTIKSLSAPERKSFILKTLKKKDKKSYTLLTTFPESIQESLLHQRDAHGNVQVSQIPTEKLLIALTEKTLEKQKKKVPFNSISHFFGYEGRCGFPSKFDASLTFNLGLCASSLVLQEKTAYMACINHLDNKGEAYGIPLKALIHLETREGKQNPVIKKALVDLKSKAFKYFSKNRENWTEDTFICPGPIQFWGPKELTDTLPKSTSLNYNYKNIFHFT